MDIEKEFQPEFDLLKNEGRLTSDWSNIYYHCKLEGIVATILSNLINLNETDSKVLIKAAILHDWYKRYEIEQAQGFGEVEYKNSENNSYNKLLALGVDNRIVEVAHSVGAFSLKDILKSRDLLKRIMHFIDDICLHDKIVEIEERMIYNEQKYPQINEEGKKEFDGKTYFEVQRTVGKQIQSEIEAILNLQPNSLVKLIKQYYELIVSAN